MSRYLLPALLCLFMLSCRPDTYIPKPRGYYHIDLPEHTYKTFDEPGFPYTFEYPAFAKIIRDTSFFGKKPENPYWLYIDLPPFKGRIFMSYKEISPTETFAKLLEDSHRLSYFHTKKADDIQEYPYNNGHGVIGITYYVSGNAASAYQFIATDSVKHFLRGALYFDVTPNADSLKPVNDFMRIDLQHMINSMRWK